MSSEELLKQSRSLLGEDSIGFDPAALSKEPNITLHRGQNVALFEYVSPGVYEGHYLYRELGRKALTDSKGFLTEMFSGPARVIKGLTPIKHRGATWMNRQLGFKFYGIIDTVAGPMGLYILTKEEFNQ